MRRQRSRNLHSPSSSIDSSDETDDFHRIHHEYTRLPTTDHNLDENSKDNDNDDDDEEDNIPYLEEFPKIPPSTQSNLCTWMILVFSIAGVIYLWSISIILESNSLYLQIENSEYDKPTLGKTVRIAAILYGSIAVLSSLLLVRSIRERWRLERLAKVKI